MSKEGHVHFNKILRVQCAAEKGKVQQTTLQALSDWVQLTIQYTRLRTHLLPFRT